MPSCPHKDPTCEASYQKTLEITNTDQKDASRQIQEIEQIPQKEVSFPIVWVLGSGAVLLVGLAALAMAFWITYSKTKEMEGGDEKRKKPK